MSLKRVIDASKTLHEILTKTAADTDILSAIVRDGTLLIQVYDPNGTTFDELSEKLGLHEASMKGSTEPDGQSFIHLHRTGKLGNTDVDIITVREATKDLIESIAKPR